MSGSYLLDPLVFLIQTLFGLYIAVVAIRFLLQWVRADFYNPLSQFVVRITTPVLRPLRRVIPGYGGLDLAALVLIWLLSTVQLGLMALVVGLERSLFGAPLWAIPSMVELFINILLFSVLIRAILSWINPDPYNPAAALLDRLTAPVMRPAQRVIRPIGGIDLAPLVVIIGLVLLNMLLLPPLKWLVASPF
ncbi:YggT family protein [Allochromatium warmingii]|uniref:YggT family protein n=1 Tax=Allochromatium warmingii TaxID=61595 RepID=A0A1H3ARX5_ALLWA|nr:YggT family protein [Allochromatium warmingii]SDX32148.1 YggT family protein [Allochromatium warmingii]